MCVYSVHHSICVSAAAVVSIGIANYTHTHTISADVTAEGVQEAAYHEIRQMSQRTQDDSGAPVPLCYQKFFFGLLQKKTLNLTACFIS